MMMFEFCDKQEKMLLEANRLLGAIASCKSGGGVRAPPAKHVEGRMAYLRVPLSFRQAALKPLWRDTKAQSDPS